jgi:hypothetical protein
VHSTALYLHSYLRWLVLLTGAVLITKTLEGWYAGRAWTPTDDRLHAALVHLISLQFLLGLALYAWLSPLTPAFFADPGPGMKVPTLRFFMLDHPVSMLIGIGILHSWRSRTMRVADGRARHRQVTISTLIALLIIAASIPWPGLSYGRAMFR